MGYVCLLVETSPGDSWESPKKHLNQLQMLNFVGRFDCHDFVVCVKVVTLSSEKVRILL